MKSEDVYHTESGQQTSQHAPPPQVLDGGPRAWATMLGGCVFLHVFIGFDSDIDAPDWLIRLSRVHNNLWVYHCFRCLSAQSIILIYRVGSLLLGYGCRIITYTRTHAASASAVSWVGSTQLFLLIVLGLPAGRLLDSAGDERKNLYIINRVLFCRMIWRPGSNLHVIYESAAADAVCLPFFLWDLYQRGSSETRTDVRQSCKFHQVRCGSQSYLL